MGDQLVPFQDSVAFLSPAGGSVYPPKPKAAVCVPAPAKSFLLF
jgi:hypothetical protein